MAAADHRELGAMPRLVGRSHSSKHWNLWLQSAAHVVIIKETKTGYFLKTAYPIKAHEAADWVKRYMAAKKNGPRLVKPNLA